MTDITTYAPQPAQLQSVADFQTRAVQQLAEWAQSADAAIRIAHQLAQSSFVPLSLRGKPQEIAAAILAGSEVGLSPMASIRSFDVIQGQAAARALTLRAVAQSMGHEIVMLESSNTRCRMKGRRRGSDEWQTVTWTIDRARDLQLTGKDNWKKQPGTMLVARATSEVTRLVAADALLGIGYSAEEIADGGAPEYAPTVPTESLTAPTPGTRKMSRKTLADPAPEPDPEPVDITDAELVEDAPDPITEQQSKKLHALLREAGITEREVGIASCSKLIGREIGSTKELTKGEASRIIDALLADTADTADQAWLEGAQ